MTMVQELPIRWGSGHAKQGRRVCRAVVATTMPLSPCPCDGPCCPLLPSLVHCSPHLQSPHPCSLGNNRASQCLACALPHVTGWPCSQPYSQRDVEDLARHKDVTTLSPFYLDLQDEVLRIQVRV